MDALLKQLKLNKLKITEDRKEVLGALHEAGRPVTIAEIYEKAREKHPSLNLTTVYRAISTLEEVGLVTKLNFGENKYLYELNQPDNHHHHLICTSCRRVLDLEKSFQESFLERVSREQGFQINSHTFEIYGLCSNCQ